MKIFYYNTQELNLAATSDSLRVNKSIHHQLQCKCNGSEDVKLVTKFGCATGGYPYCKDPFDFYCQDGTQVTQVRMARYGTRSLAHFSKFKYNHNQTYIGRRFAGTSAASAMTERLRSAGLKADILLGVRMDRESSKLLLAFFKFSS